MSSSDVANQLKNIDQDKKPQEGKARPPRIFEDPYGFYFYKNSTKKMPLTKKTRTQKKKVRLKLPKNIKTLRQAQQYVVKKAKDGSLNINIIVKSQPYKKEAKPKSRKEKLPRYRTPAQLTQLALAKTLEKIADKGNLREVVQDNMARLLEDKSNETKQELKRLESKIDALPMLEDNRRTLPRLTHVRKSSGDEADEESDTADTVPEKFETMDELAEHIADQYTSTVQISSVPPSRLQSPMAQMEHAASELASALSAESKAESKTPKKKKKAPGDTFRNLSAAKREEYRRKSLATKKFNREYRKKKESEIMQQRQASIPEEEEQSGAGRKYLTALYNDQIDDYFADEPRFTGTIASDEILTKIPKKIPQGFIMNTDPSNMPGEHWVACYISPDSIEYYDPEAQQPSSRFTKDIHKLITKWELPVMLKYKINRVKDQRTGTNYCGYHCMRFLDDRFHGIPYELTTRFSSPIKDESSKGYSDIKKEFSII